MIIITGPTALGKSALAMEIASKKNGCIVNVDSMQIYKSIPIITAQPSEGDQTLIPHFLYGFANDDEQFSFGKWVKMLADTILEVQKKEMTPIIVGGTMMYVYLLLTGYSEIPHIPDLVRISANNLYNEVGHDNFISIVKKLDANTLVDRQRLIYNYCLITHTGNNMAHYHCLPKINFFGENNAYGIKCNSIKPEIIIPEKSRANVYEACNSRFIDMINDGVIEEVSRALPHKHLLINRATGFKYIASYLKGDIEKNAMTEKCQQETRNYAKRQIIWLRKFISEGIISSAQVAS